MSLADSAGAFFGWLAAAGVGSFVGTIATLRRDRWTQRATVIQASDAVQHLIGPPPAVGRQYPPEPIDADKFAAALRAVRAACIAAGISERVTTEYVELSAALQHMSENAMTSGTAPRLWELQTDARAMLVSNVWHPWRRWDHRRRAIASRKATDTAAAQMPLVEEALRFARPWDKN